MPVGGDGAEASERERAAGPVCEGSEAGGAGPTSEGTREGECAVSVEAASASPAAPVSGRPGSQLLQGAALLGAAAVISKLLGTLQKIPLQNLAGDGAFGIYSAVYPLYTLVLFLTTAGFPIAVSKFVSERLAMGDRDGANRVVGVSSAVLGAAGLVSFAFVYGGAGVIAGWIGIDQTKEAVRSASFALLVAPLLAVLRGYFQGCQTLIPTAVSQVAEQLVRVLTMIGLLIFLLANDASIGRIAAGATFGSVAGALAGLLVLLPYWQRDRAAHRGGGAAAEVDRMASEAADEAGVAAGTWSAEEAGRAAIDGRAAAGGAKGAIEAQSGRQALDSSEDEPGREASMPDIGLTRWQWARRIAAYALPVALGAIVVPMLTLVDTFTMPRLLEAAGLGEAEAMRQFGLYNRGLPLVQLVVLIASSMSAVLVPAIAEAQLRGQRAEVRARAETAIRLAWLVGLPAACGLAAAAVPINVMLYRTSEGSATLALLAITALLSTLNAVTASVLQGAGAIRTPALCLLIAAALKALGNAALMPRWGIEGAALSAVIAFAAAAGLSTVQALRCTGARLALRRHAAGPLLAAALMGALLAALQLAARPALAGLGMPARWAYSAIAITGVVGGAAVYAMTLLRSGSVSSEDLQLLSPRARKLIPFLIKYKLLPPATKSGAQRQGGIY
ncbi:polysaccharide biosynthesis protein [Paenibacillus athensensis]|uniref:Uncharacterized protein n=2 Tax=Paenibacillus athensensis TaxID=1967502 RepID=A0A4Y8PVS3_9BACL|nr:polysaccharide biosynthesis protein [Paenibacillus athensensis]